MLSIASIHNVLINIIDFIFSLLAFVLNAFTPITAPLVYRCFQSIGIEINGQNEEDIEVKDNRFYGLLLSKTSTGLGESYINGYCDTDNLQLLMTKMITSNFKFCEMWSPYRILHYLVYRYFDVLDIDHNKEYINEHYNSSPQIISDLYVTENYSAMFLTDAEEVENCTVENVDQILESGTFKMRELIARKLNLKPGMKVLEIGCGFGGLAKHLCERYKVHVTGVTISKDMAKRAKELCQGLDVHIEQMDYRLVTGKFDRIVSIEMFEHVGENHHREYFEKIDGLLNESGLFVFQVNAISDQHLPSYTPMFEKCLQMFCYFPRLEEIVFHSRDLFILENLDSLSLCYELTFTAIVKKMIAKKELLVKKYTEKVYRQWLLYLSLAATNGMTKSDRVYQIVFTKNVANNSFKYKPQFIS